MYMLPFDHRSSFEQGLFGFTAPLTLAQRAKVTDAKQVVYAALRKAIADGVARDQAALLVDEEFGRDILLDARAHGLITAAPAEKSGQAVFELQYGDDFAHHIEALDPTYCKVLVRYNPEGDAKANALQCERLLPLSEYLRGAGRAFLFELLVPPEPVHLAQVTQDAYDSLLRPSLTRVAIRQLQDAGIAPTIWKLEGYDRAEDAAAIVQAAQRGNRSDVRCIVLGRHADERRVRHWLEIAATVPGYIGFAVGRSTFWQPVDDWISRLVTRAEAVSEIARRYREWVDIWEAARRAPAAVVDEQHISQGGR
jgi:5-dehydro-2-deoxygluconokinase